MVCRSLAGKQTRFNTGNDVGHTQDFTELCGSLFCAALACIPDFLSVAHAAGICHFLFYMPLADWASSSLLYSSLPLQPNNCEGNANNTSTAVLLQ